jgi:hypothetical protein
MSDFQAIADRVEIEALRGEYTDAVMMRDYERVASLFTPLGAELCHLPRPLPAHRRRLEVHGARLRGQVPRSESAGGLGARPSRRRPLTCRPGYTDLWPRLSS